MKLSKEKEHMELNPYTLWLLELYFIFNSTNLNLLIRIALKATIILTFPKYTPVMLVQG